MAGYLLLTISLIVFFVVLHYVEYIDDFMDRGATMQDVFTIYYPSYVPEIVRLTSPLAIFLAVVYLTGKLAQELQIMALQTSGVSLYRLLIPYFFVGVLLTGGMFWFNGWIVPTTNLTVLEFDQKYLKDAPQQMEVNDIHRQIRPGSLVTVGYYESRSDVAHRVSLQQFTAGRHLAMRIDAQRMVWVDSLGAWRMEEATLRSFAPDGPEIRREMARLDTVLNVFPRDFKRTERDVESMTIPAAAEYVESLQRSGAGGIGRSLVGYYVKFAYPFANLILVLIGVPLAAVRRRGGQAVQIGLGLLTAFVYLAVMKLTEPFGYSGELHPALTAWLPHVAFTLVALFLLFRARK